MNLETVISVKLSEGAVLPVYSSLQASGADICACLDNEQEIVIEPGCWESVPTGIRMEIPEGYEIQVRPRSGIAAKFGITVLNSPGTIDSDYRGEIKVILINFSKKPFIVHNNDRIAQIVLAPVIKAVFTPVNCISETERGEKGFGSTGI